MANEQNLRPCEYKLSQEEAKKGGINSGIARREKANLRKIANLVNDSEITDKKMKDKIKKITGLEDEEVTGAAAVVAGLYTSAVGGNVVYRSLINGWSYEKMCKNEYLFISKTDFYSQRRKAIFYIKNMLLLTNDENRRKFV